MINWILPSFPIAIYAIVGEIIKKQLHTVSTRMKKNLLLLLALCLSSVLAFGQATQLDTLLTVQLTATKGTKVKFFMVGKTSQLYVDAGDGQAFPVQVTTTVPENVNEIPAYEFVVQADNPKVSILGAGISAFLYPYPGPTGTLTGIKLPGAKDLQILDIDNSSLSAIDLSACASLRKLWLYANPGLKTLDVSKTTNLEELYIQMTDIKEIDLSALKKLRILVSFGSKQVPVPTMKSLRRIDLSQCPAIEEVHAYESDLESINVEGCTALRRLHIGDSKVTEVKLKNNTGLISAQFYGNTALTSIDFTQMPNVEQLYFDNTSITEADLTTLSRIKRIDAFNAKLTKILFNSNCYFTESLRLFSNNLDGCALNAMYHSLGNKPRTLPSGMIVLAYDDYPGGNPGLATSKTTIAKEKGWYLARLAKDGTSTEIVGDGTAPDCGAAVESILADRQGRIWPTVTTGAVTLQYPFAVASVYVYTLDGACVAQLKPTGDQISLADLAVGQYVLLVMGNDGSAASARVIRK